MILWYVILAGKEYPAMKKSVRKCVLMEVNALWELAYALKDLEVKIAL